MFGAIGGFITFIIIAVIILFVLSTCIRVVPQAQALVVERLGAYLGTYFQSTRHSFLHSWNHSPGLWRTRAVFQGSSRQGKRSHSFFIFSRQ